MIKQKGERLFNRNFFISEKIPYIASVINIAADRNMKEYHLGAVCALTKEALLRNKVPKQSKKKNNTKMF